MVDQTAAGDRKSEMLRQLKLLRKGHGMVFTRVAKCTALVAELGIEPTELHRRIIDASNKMGATAHAAALRNALNYDGEHSGILTYRREDFATARNILDMKTIEKWENQAFKELLERLLEKPAARTSNTLLVSTHVFEGTTTLYEESLCHMEDMGDWKESPYQGKMVNGLKYQPKLTKNATLNWGGFVEEKNNFLIFQFPRDLPESVDLLRLEACFHDDLGRSEDNYRDVPFQAIASEAPNVRLLMRDVSETWVNHATHFPATAYGIGHLERDEVLTQFQTELQVRLLESLDYVAVRADFFYPSPGRFYLLIWDQFPSGIQRLH